MDLWSRLVRVEPPAVAALTLEEAKAHLGLDGIDAHDANVGRFVADALAQLDGSRSAAGLCLVTQTWRLSLDAWPGCILVPLGPVQAVTGITYVDPDGGVQTLDADQYVYDLDRDPLRIYPAEGACWPALRCAPGAIKVTVRCGFGDAAADVPADLIGAAKLIVGHRWRHRGDGAAVEPPQAIADVLARYRAAFVA